MSRPAALTLNPYKTAMMTVLTGLLLMPITAHAGNGGHTVTLKQVEDLKAVFATVESIDVVPARVRTGGTIADLSVDEGSRVEAGQTIARVKDPKLQLEIAAINARSESLKAQRSLAQTALKRAQSLRKSGAGSQARLDQARTDLEVVDRNLAAMRAERAVIAQRQTEGAVLAPASGRVLSVKVTTGTVVLPGETVATIAQETYILRLHLPERHAASLSQGERVLVGGRSLSGLGGVRPPLREGRVRQVYPELDQGRVVADVSVDGLGDFFIGERTRVYVPTGTRPAMVIPAAYLFSRYDLSYVRLKEGGETVVQVGRSTEDGTEILSGIRPGDILLPPGQKK